MSVEHYENFPVASVLCPPAIRPAVQAIYHFARTADDLADEGTLPQSARLAALGAFRADLMSAWAGRQTSARWAPIFERLAEARARFDLPIGPLLDLLSAFEQDTGNPAYASREALLDYCRRSANPVGRLLMHLYGIDDRQCLEQSDAICTALQLINFWQDMSVDMPRGRIYIPHDDARAQGIDPHSLAALADGPRARALVRGLCEWADQLMLCGAPLARRIPGRAGWELRLVVQGGQRILKKIAALDHATLRHRPTLGAADVPAMLWRALLAFPRGVRP